MKKNLFKRGMAGLLSLVMCLTTLVGIGTTTAYAAGERAEVYLVSFPRSGDANIDYSGTWGASQSPVYERLAFRRVQVHYHSSNVLV